MLPYDEKSLFDCQYILYFKRVDRRVMFRVSVAQDPLKFVRNDNNFIKAIESGDESWI